MNTINLNNFNNLIIDMKIYDLLIYYTIYSFLGWCAEVGYAYKNQRKFVNRGFLFGPLCPIYGAAVLSVIKILSNFHYNLAIMFILATVLVSTIEYITGFVLEKLFKTKYWDYTEDPLNLHGRICFHFSLMWGAVSIFILRVIHPLIVYVVSLIPDGFRFEIALILVCYLFVDFASTLNSLLNFKNIFYRIQLDGSYVNSIRLDTRNNIQNIIQEIKNRFSNILGK